MASWICVPAAAWPVHISRMPRAGVWLSTICDQMDLGWLYLTIRDQMDFGLTIPDHIVTRWSWGDHTWQYVTRWTWDDTSIPYGIANFWDLSVPTFFQKFDWSCPKHVPYIKRTMLTVYLWYFFQKTLILNEGKEMCPKNVTQWLLWPLIFPEFQLVS